MEKIIKRTEREREYKEEMESFFSEASGSISDKLNNFTRFVDRQTLATFLYKYELFKKVVDVQGSILEFGVFRGGGSFTFAQLSTILEPYNYQRRIIGFDTFGGFPAVSEIDDLSDPDISPQKGDFSTHEKFYEELMQNIGLFNMNRFLNNVEKLMFVKGDINVTFPRFLEENKHLVVSLAYFDLDIYLPTKNTLELILPRIPKGGIIAFDELNNPDWPGETQAVIEAVGINNLRLKRVTFEPCRSYCVVE
ncbi:class I SAM-dependent methyltransferase [candidate division KSB1 bacterium]|nr:class I SAM-dependent methyltransferase [candidate division KSB1 bacterium]